MIFRNLDIMTYIMHFIVLFPTIAIHEYFHGYVAHKLGDPTAKSMGRLTLNPLAHLDPVGALMMIFVGFGWAKPVPVNPYYFKNPKRDMALVSFAGPLSNLVLAFISFTLWAIFRVCIYQFSIAENNVADFLYQILLTSGIMNICFAVFNLIPCPPLDGSKILFSVLPNRAYNKFLTIERFGFIILIVLSVTGILGTIISKVAAPFETMMLSWANFLIRTLFNIIG